jgi:DNA-binding HxlR family transcriptional regulator
MSSTLAEEASLKCPYSRLLEILGKPHTLAILYSFGITSPMRFTKLQKSLDLQPKILTARLRELVSFGLLDRKSYNEIPPRVEYELTPKGKGLKSMFEALHEWSGKYQLVAEPAPVARARPREGHSPSRK